MQLTVNERVNFLIERLTNGNKSAFAKEIGVGGGVVQDLVGGRLNKPSFEVLQKIVNTYPEINLEWLVKGEGDPLIKETAATEETPTPKITPHRNGKAIVKNHELQVIPLYDITAAAGLSALYNSSNNILDYISIPNLSRCDGAIYVKGDSMYPLIKHGSIVAFQQIENLPDDLYFGELYVVDMSTPGREKIVVKYVQRSELGEDYVKLVSYNEKHHPPKDIHLSKIRAIAEVKASILVL